MLLPNRCPLMGLAVARVDAVIIVVDPAEEALDPADRVVAEDLPVVDPARAHAREPRRFRLRHLKHPQLRKNPHQRRRHLSRPRPAAHQLQNRPQKQKSN